MITPRTVYVVEILEPEGTEWRPQLPCLGRESADVQQEAFEKYNAVDGARYQVVEYVRRDEEEGILGAWLERTLGRRPAKSAVERGLRVIEEASELAQCLMVTRKGALAVVNAVYDRPSGVTDQEIAGALVTVLLAAWSTGISASAALRREIERIHLPEIVERVRRRQNEKYATGTAALPVGEDVR